MTRDLDKYIQGADLCVLDLTRENQYLQVGKKMSWEQKRRPEKKTHHTQPPNHATPKANVIQCLLSPHPSRLLHHHQRQLQHLTRKPVTPQLLGNASHHNLVAHGGYQKRDDGRHGLSHKRSRGAVDVSPQEAIDGHVPLARKLHPVRAVPPVRVEMAVGEAGDFSERPQNVLEDDEEDEQERQHEGEQHPAYRLRQHQQGLQHGGRRPRLELRLRVQQDGVYELFRRDGQEEYAAKGGHDLGSEGGPVYECGAGIFELVAEGRAEEVVTVVSPSQVARVGRVAHGACELPCEVIAEGAHHVFIVHRAWTAAIAMVPGDGETFGIKSVAFGMFHGRVLVGGRPGGGFGVVEGAQSLFRLREVAVVEGVRVHLHEERHGVQEEEDLRRPRPFEVERQHDPEHEPRSLICALHRDSSSLPREDAVG